MPTPGNTDAVAPVITIAPYSNNSPTYLIPVSILGFIALVLVVLRIYTRLTRTRQLYIDDWLIIVAEVCCPIANRKTYLTIRKPLSLANICIAAGAIAYGWGKPIAYVTPSDLMTSLKLQFAIQTTWIFTLCFVRLSVACSLLRFGTERWWNWTLYFLMGFQCLISASWVVIQFGQCTPVSANWESVPDVKCWPTKPIVDYGWAIGCMCSLPLIN